MTSIDNGDGLGKFHWKSAGNRVKKSQVEHGESEWSVQCNKTLTNGGGGGAVQLKWCAHRSTGSRAWKWLECSSLSTRCSSSSSSSSNTNNHGNNGCLRVVLTPNYALLIIISHPSHWDSASLLYQSNQFIQTLGLEQTITFQLIFNYFDVAMQIKPEINSS